MPFFFLPLDLALALLVASLVMAQDAWKFMKAYSRGDYAAEMREWKPLAEQRRACDCSAWVAKRVVERR